MELSSKLMVPRFSHQWIWSSLRKSRLLLIRWRSRLPSKKSRKLSSTTLRSSKKKHSGKNARFPIQTSTYGLVKMNFGARASWICLCSKIGWTYLKKESKKLLNPKKFTLQRRPNSKRSPLNCRIYKEISFRQPSKIIANFSNRSKSWALKALNS
jgi:hypothetical protein